MDERPPYRALTALALAAAAYRQWFGDFRSWLTAAALPVLLLLLIDFALLQTLAEQAPNEMGFGGGLTGFLSNIVNAIIYTLFAVSWHRRILLGEPPRAVPAVGAYHVRFLFWVILLFFLSGFVFVTAFSLVQLLSGGNSLFLIPGLIVGLALSLYFSARVSVIYPATALGGRMGLTQAWAMTRGQAWAIFWGFVLGLLPAILLLLVLLLAFGLSLGGPPPPAAGEAANFDAVYLTMSALSVIVALFIITLSVGIASNVFKALVARPPTS